MWELGGSRQLRPDRFYAGALCTLSVLVYCYIFAAMSASSPQCALETDVDCTVVADEMEEADESDIMEEIANDLRSQVGFGEDAGCVEKDLSYFRESLIDQVVRSNHDAEGITSRSLLFSMAERSMCCRISLDTRRACPQYPTRLLYPNIP